MKTIPERTYEFGLRIIKLIQDLPRNSTGYAIGNQIIRSGTSVGANIEEAQNSPTKKDFVRGMTVALKEARETYYWLRLIRDAKLIETDILEVMRENSEIVRILTTSIKNAKKSL